MKNEINEIIDAMCAPGLAAMSPSDLAFLSDCDSYCFNEFEGNTVGDAIASLKGTDFNDYKHIAISIFAHIDDKHVSVNEIAGLRNIFDDLERDTNVVWSFTFADVPIGKRKVIILLAS